jgi:hypothetical protein
MKHPINCWIIRKNRIILDKIPDDGCVDSTVDMLAYLRRPANDKISIKYGECSGCEKCND